MPIRTQVLAGSAAALALTACAGGTPQVESINDIKTTLEQSGIPCDVTSTTTAGGDGLPCQSPKGTGESSAAGQPFDVYFDVGESQPGGQSGLCSVDNPAIDILTYAVAGARAQMDDFQWTVEEVNDSPDGSSYANAWQRQALVGQGWWAITSSSNTWPALASVDVITKALEPAEAVTVGQYCGAPATVGEAANLLPAADQSRTVVYRVGGTSPDVAEIEYTSESGNTVVKAAPPWSTTVTLDAGQYITFLVSQGGNAGEVTCQLEIEGKSKRAHTGGSDGFAVCNDYLS